SIRRPFRRKLGVHVACAFPGPMRTAQAERHAPKGAKADGRMEPEDAARRILAALRWRRRVIVPGWRAKLFAVLGRLFPKLATRAMRRFVHDRLDGEVW